MLSLTDLEKKTAQGVVTIFETSKLAGPTAYSQVTVLRGDTGGLTFGREQTTLMSGNLYLLIQDYVDNNGKYINEFRLYLDRLREQDTALNKDTALHALLRESGTDPIMCAVQDAFFDRVYWMPAVREAKRLNMSLPLSASVVYDSFIHGSWVRIRDRVALKTPTDPSSEKRWIEAYVKARREWLSHHSNALLQKCVYRQDAYLKLIQVDNWKLALPLTVRGVLLTPQTLGAVAVGTLPTLDTNNPPSESAKDGSDVRRLLMLKGPPMMGLDVRAVQDALVREGYPVVPDSVFGPNTATCVRLFQTARNLKADGIVGQSTRSALNIQ